MGEVCPCCRQKVRKLNPHRMCAQMVALLQIFERANDWVRVEAGRAVYVDGRPERAPYRAGAYASYLVWFGLVESGEHRSALYRITEKGVAFLRGEHQVPAVLWVKGGEVIERSTEMVTLASIKGVVLDKDYWDNYWRIQKKQGPQ